MYLFWILRHRILASSWYSGSDAKTPPIPSKFPDQFKEKKPTRVFVLETPVDSCSSLVLIWLGLILI